MATDNDKLDEIFHESFIPVRKPVPSSNDHRVCLQSYPPLGQVTTVKNGDIALTAVLELPSSYAPESWQVACWYSTDGREWTETLLSSMEAEHLPQDLHHNIDSLSRRFFVARLPLNSSLQFTLKFRQGESNQWRWIHDELNMGDGYVVAQSVEPKSEELSDLIPDLNAQWEVTRCKTQAPGSTLWSLEATVPSAEADVSAFRNIEIGMPWGSFLRWFALVRISPPWLAPRQGQKEFSLDKDAILCSFLSPQGRSLVLLAISGLGDVLPVFRHTSRGSVSVNIRNDGASPDTAVILAAASDDFEAALAMAMDHARSLVTEKTQTSQAWNEELKALTNAVRPEWRDTWYDGLGYCTWNALGQQLTEKKVRDAVDKLANNNIKLTSFLIDDNWQSIDFRGHGQFQHGWVDFEAEPTAFPNGLKAVASYIRERHPDIQHVAVWHALLGYWGGIAPDGNIAKKYKTVEVVRDDPERRFIPLGGKMTVVAKEDVPRFYDDFYRFLSDSGIDAVKTDAQNMIDTWTQASVRRDLIKTYLDTWRISSLRHFSVKAISCMSQIPQALFHSHLPRDRPTLLVRSSDDFFPDIAASHPWHVWINAHNNIFMQHLNVLPDWDMFQTVHDYSGFHAAARCVSGGPIYITDVPGEHNMGLIHQMTGSTPRGKTIKFRPSAIGRAVHPYTGYHDDALLKIGSYHGAVETGTAILAIFNVSLRPLTELIPLSCFPGVVSGTKYVVRSHTTGVITSPIGTDASSSLLTASLDIRGYDILSASPLTRVAGAKRGETLISTLGLLGKMTGSAAILTNNIAKLEDGRVLLETRLKALGVLGVYISALPDMTVGSDIVVTIQEQVVPKEAIVLSNKNKHVLEVDIEGAWEKMKLGGVSSEHVDVKVYFDG